jgi:hypothetical protein
METGRVLRECENCQGNKEKYDESSVEDHCVKDTDDFPRDDKIQTQVPSGNDKQELRPNAMREIFAALRMTAGGL